MGIDEGQFFPDLAPFCDEMANEGKTVVVAALNGTFRREVSLCHSHSALLCVIETESFVSSS